ncbi:hypothetical protein ACQ4M3_20840 [Leptolyngbya sp. AN03gr2]|uniref:hypothetical protein n=1 Tax=unclassified Leptolyngbya TaxID=2650499 RepID=UPI003D31C12D
MQTKFVGAEFEPLPGLKVKFINAGHIVGAVCIYLQYAVSTMLGLKHLTYNFKRFVYHQAQIAT